MTSAHFDISPIQDMHLAKANPKKAEAEKAAAEKATAEKSLAISVWEHDLQHLKLCKLKHHCTPPSPSLYVAEQVKI